MDPIQHKNTGAHIRQKTLNVATHGSRWASNAARKRYNQYKERHKFPQILLALDLVLVGVVVGFLATLIGFFLFGRFTIVHQIDFEATIAPATITSGAPSTLIFSWQNTADEPLRDARLEINYPDNFLLQEVVYADTNPEGRHISLGDIPAGNRGSVKVRGVMFGDVGGDQTFTAHMDFRHGERNRLLRKTSTHTFSPTESALTIDATVPDTLVAGQEVDGLIHIVNNGSVTFEAVSIKPKRSDFAFSVDNRFATTDGDETPRWTITNLAPGEERDIPFTGIAPTTEEASDHEWGFVSFFRFADFTYQQSETDHPFRLIPSPVRLDLSVPVGVLTPGDSVRTEIRVENISDQPIRGLELFLNGTSPFLSGRDGEGTTYLPASREWAVISRDRTLDPGESISLDAAIPVRTRVEQNSVQSFTNPTTDLRLRAQYLIAGESATIVSSSSPITLPITSPISLRSFGRYSSPQGDQIGRGPLPPVVAEETRYWVFWNITGTMNALENVQITGTLPSYARFTGRQTTTLGEGPTSANGRVQWTHPSLSPTFDPASKVVQIGFEIGITPQPEHIGDTLVILDGITLTGQDAFTGEIVRGFGPRVTTDLANDPMARGLDRVVSF